MLQLLRLSTKGCQKLSINRGVTPLIYALSLGLEEVAGVLLAPAGKEADAARRAYLNTSCGNVTVLFRCMERLPDSPLVSQLVQMGASPLERCIRGSSKEQSTPLHLAITARQARGRRCCLLPGCCRRFAGVCSNMIAACHLITTNLFNNLTTQATYVLYPGCSQERQAPPGAEPLPALDAMLGALERESGQAGRLSTAADSKGRTPLHLAIAALDVNLVRRLVDAVSATCGVACDWDQTPEGCAAAAARAGPAAVLCTLVSHLKIHQPTA